MKRILLGAVAAALAAATGGLVVLLAGLYDISAADQHLAPTYRMLNIGLRASVRLRAASIEVPPLDDAELVARGLAHFRASCVSCHGAPGIAPEAFALGMTPIPANLVVTARERRAAELFWTIKFGIKMTGMPAWQFRMNDDDIWATVAFLRTLPQLSPRDYQALRTPEHWNPTQATPWPVDIKRGREATRQYGCATCHDIPGIVGANAPVGPPLAGFATRSVIAGVLPNTNENLVRWIRRPAAVKEGSAMPDLGVAERDAIDIAAYLGTLH